MGFDWIDVLFKLNLSWCLARRSWPCVAHIIRGAGEFTQVPIQCSSRMSTCSFDSIVLIERGEQLKRRRRGKRKSVRDAPATPANPVRRTHSNNRCLARPHQFAPKNNFKTESCGPCQKRIKFGKSCYKCHECRMAAHPECRDKAPLPCVPCGSGTKTPSKAGQGYTWGLALADYTPPTNPWCPPS